ncbi:MAG: tetratricopeptide repeat protein [Planctomycetota bacterium]|nr:tetratricopeptide repeat protein [Planctomycetota bacterium]
MDAESAYLFRHALVREAAYQLQPPGDRAQLHAFTVCILEKDTRVAPLDLADHAAFAAQESQTVLPHAQLADIELRALQRGVELARTRFEPEVELACLRRLATHSSVSRAERGEYRLQQVSPLLTLGRLAECIAVCTEVAGASNGKLKFRALNRLGEMQRNGGNMKEAEEALGQSEAVAPPDAESQATMLLSRARLQLQRNELAPAAENLQKAEALARAEGAWALVANTLSALAILYRTKEEYSTALACLDRLEQLPLEDGAASRNTSNARGNVLWRQGRNREAETQYREAVRLAREKGDVPSQAIALGNLGNIHMDREESSDAEECYTAAIAMCREIGLQSHAALYTMALGGVHRKRGAHVEALAAYDQAESFMTAVGHLAEASSVVANRGLVLQDMGRNTEALSEFQRAEQLARRAHAPLQVASHISRQADLYGAEGRLAQAVELYRHSLQTRRGHGAEINRLDAQIQVALAEALHELGRRQEARDAVKLARRYADQCNLQAQATRATVQRSMTTLQRLEAELLH